MVLKGKVHSGAIQGPAAVPAVLDDVSEQFPRLGHIWVDQEYAGSGKAWIETQLGWRAEVVGHPHKPRSGWAMGAVIGWEALRPKGFCGVLPRRWVIECTFSWFGQSHRPSKDYEQLCASNEVLIYATMARLMLRRLAHT